jgi:hypothetical protein
MNTQSGNTWGEVGRSLNVHGRTEDEAGGGNGPADLLHAGGLTPRHGCALLWLEVLDDQLLQMPLSKFPSRSEN